MSEENTHNETEDQKDRSETRLASDCGGVGAVLLLAFVVLYINSLLPSDFPIKAAPATWQQLAACFVLGAAFFFAGVVVDRESAFRGAKRIVVAAFKAVRWFLGMISSWR